MSAGRWSVDALSGLVGSDAERAAQVQDVGALELGSGIVLLPFPPPEYEEEPPETLWHYTTRAGLQGILESRSVWATDIRYVNDASEIAHTSALFSAEVERRRPGSEGALARLYPALLREADRLRFAFSPLVFSLSKERDDLSQWRAYAAPGSAYSIGFDSNQLARRTGGLTGLRLLPCLYDLDRQTAMIGSILEFAETSVQRGDPRHPDFGKDLDMVALFVAMMLSYVAVGLKHSAFAMEREWRISVFRTPAALVEYRDMRTYLAPYTRVALTPSSDLSPVVEVMVGPSPHAEIDRQSVEGFVRSLGGADVRVSSSSVPYRNW